MLGRSMADGTMTVSHLSRTGVAVVAVFCGIATVGWILGIPSLTSLVPGWARMSLPSILCFLLVGTSIITPTLSEHWARRARVPRTAALALVVAIGTYALADFVAYGGLAGSALSSKSGYLFGDAFGR